MLNCHTGRSPRSGRWSSLKLYENALPGNYDEIKTWYPVWYRDVLEMDALWRAFGQSLDDLQAGIIRAVDNNFVDFADAETVAKLESFLGIAYDSPRTLTERRSVINAFILGSSHVGQKEIKDLVSVFTDGDIYVELVGGAVRVTVARDSDDRLNVSDCYSILSRRIPAHLGILIIFAINTILRSAQAVRLDNLTVHAAFRRGGDDAIRFDGKRKFDGTLKFNQRSAKSGFALNHAEINLYAQTQSIPAVTLKRVWGAKFNGTMKFNGSGKFSSGTVEEEV